MRLYHAFGILCLHMVVECSVPNRIESKYNALFDIVGMFPVRGSASLPMVYDAILWVESMKYAIRKANERLKGRKVFGYTIYDTHTVKHEFITTAVIDTLLGYQNNTEECKCSDASPVDRVIGIVGPAESSNSKYVHQLTSNQNLPIVSYASTSTELSENYPNFFRTVPSDEAQARFITEILVDFEWTYVSVIATDDSYGRTGMEMLRKQLKLHNICFSVVALVNTNYNEEKANSIYDDLQTDHKVHVVILWAELQFIKPFLLNAKSKGLEDHVWILSEVQGLHPWFVEFQQTYRGHILKVLQTAGADSEFEEYFTSLGANDNPWLELFFKDQNVTRSQSLRDVAHMFDFSGAGTVQNAANVLINALLDMQRNVQKCDLSNVTCPPVSLKDHQLFNRIIKNVKFEGVNQETVQFDSMGDITTATFRLYKVNKAGVYEQVDYLRGEWSVSNLSFIRELSNVTSRCSRDCHAGEYPFFDSVNRCCWTCVACNKTAVKPIKGQHKCTLCKKDSFPNPNRTLCVQFRRVYWSFYDREFYAFKVIALVTVSIAIALNLFFIALFIKYRATPIVRSSDLAMSMVQLVSHLFLFASPLLLFENESSHKCIFRTYSQGAFFILLISLTLLKITRIVRVFYLKRVVTKTQMLKQKSRDLFYILCLLLAYTCMIILAHNISPLSVNDLINESSAEISRHCNTRTFLVVHIAYVFFICILCAVQSFRGRNLPGKYNEAVYIAFAMFSSTLVTVVSLPLEASLRNFSVLNLMHCLVTVLSSFFILIFQYAYKVKILVFNPEKNSMKEFHRKRFASIGL